ncbi:MAG: PKD domain-containing protein [Actinobacteria bacterium]|nr:PKD domain-containing protein [Actinomycetota bacterium]
MNEPGDSSSVRWLFDRVSAWVNRTFTRHPFRQAIAILVALLVLSVVAFAVTRGPDTEAVVTIGLAEEQNEQKAQPSPSPSEEPSPTSSEAPEESNTEPSPEATLECRNSINPNCGPFYWDPPPGENNPLTVDVTYTPENPKAGETVTFRLTVREPDARIEKECNFRWQFGDGRWGPDGGCVAMPACAGKYGRWDTPPRQPDEWKFTVDHVYESAGEYTARFHLQSAGGDRGCGHPYASSGEGSVTFVVQEAGPG